MLEEAEDDFVVLSQKANTAITESIEGDPELGLVLSPAPKRKSGGSISGQVGRQQLYHEQLHAKVKALIAMLTAMLLLRRWASS